MEAPKTTVEPYYMTGEEQFQIQKDQIRKRYRQASKWRLELAYKIYGNLTLQLWNEAPVEMSTLKRETTEKAVYAESV